MKKILIVDNDRFFLEVIKDLIKHEGHEVLTAEDGLSALDILESFTPDVIFLDMVMPNIDGKRLCRILRNMKDFKDAYIVSLSATAAEDSGDIMRAGVDASIAKGPLNEMAVRILNVIDKRTDSLSELFSETMGLPGRIRERGITREFLSIQRHFEIILGQIDEGVFELAADGRVVYANSGAASLMHLAEEDMLRRPFLDLFQEESHRAVRILLEGGTEKSKQVSDDNPLILNEYQVHMGMYPIPDSEGKRLVIFRNVTEQKKAEAALRKSEERYHLLFENASDGIFVLQDDAIKFPNKRVSEMFGFTANQLLDLPFFDLVHPEDRDALIERCRQILRGDEVWGIYPLRMLSRSEEELWVELNAVPIQWDGRPAILNFVRAVTKKRLPGTHFRQDVTRS
jgi:PAS domain S-box-containing protein